MVAKDARKSKKIYNLPVVQNKWRKNDEKIFQNVCLDTELEMVTFENADS